jgi:cytoskeleton protein RodZ
MNEQQSLIPMSPGETLRQGRRLMGWTIADVAHRLKCAPEIVASMEADDVTGRLAPIYRKGFLKRYASLIGVPESTIQAWLETNGEPPKLKSVFPIAAGSRSSERWVRATSYVLASLLVGTLAWQMSHEAVRLAQNTPQPGEPDTLVNTMDVTAGQPVENDAHVNASIAALESLRPAGGRTGDAGRAAWDALESNGRTDLQDGEFRLHLETSGDSWVEIRDGQGGMLEQDLVRGGENREYQGFGPFRITLGRASAVQLFVDGELVDLQPHTQDDVVQMNLDPAEMTAAAEPPAADSD